MAFQDYLYESDDGNNSYLIRLDTDQATVAGAVTGTPTDAFHVIANNSRRKFGVNPRHIIAKRVVGTGAAAKSFSTRLAICTVAAFTALAVGATVSINGTSYTVTAKNPESKR